MKRLPIVPALLLSALQLCAFQAAQAADVTLERVIALATTYFRDSAEIPMDVAVTTVVTGKDGKPKKQAHSSVRMMFHGYNQQSGKFSLNGNSGWTNTWALRDSMSGNLAAFVAGLLLAPRKENVDLLEIRQPAQPGQPIVVTNRPEPCEAFKLIPPGRYLFPAKACGVGQFRLTMKGADALAFRHYTFDSAGLPVPAKVPYLGDVRITAFHTDVDFQEGSLPGDPKPFLWPKQTITLVTTDRGTVSMTNQYSPRPSGKH